MLFGMSNQSQFDNTMGKVSQEGLGRMAKPINKALCTDHYNVHLSSFVGTFRTCDGYP